jgi:hypothetical protein
MFSGFRTVIELLSAERLAKATEEQLPTSLLLELYDLHCWPEGQLFGHMGTPIVFEL